MSISLDQRGFTLIEVMVAITLLLIGVLGTVAMIDGANATTLKTKQREGATNLTREVVENARALDYDKLSDAEIVGLLQTRMDLPDESAASGWQVSWARGSSRALYTVSIDTCIYDDGNDSAGSHTGEDYCANSATTPAGDSNPDDYRRLDIDVTWTGKNGVTGTLPQTAVVNNPSGGLGPRITGLEQCTPACATPGATIATESAIVFNATTASAAQTFKWEADDGVSTGSATGGPTAWNFTWDLKQPQIATYSCGVPPTWVLDGTYVMSGQAFDTRGIPGNLRTVTVQINRSAPLQPCGFAGGYNPPITGRGFPIVDFEWLANPERDILRYEVFRKGVGANPDVKVCEAEAPKTSCEDQNPPDPATTPTVQYYVRAHDETLYTASPLITVVLTGNLTPAFPAGATLTVALSDGDPLLSWTAATDSDGTIQFYRIYRNGQLLADRLNRTANSVTNFTDLTSNNVNNQFWVTAVDNKWAESEPIGPVSLAGP